MSHDRPVAAVTGAGDGIGWATATGFAQRGYTVCLIDIDAGKAAERARELGNGHLALGCDVANEVDVRGMVAQIGSQFGRLDALVNNAGIGSPHLPTTEQTLDSFEKVLKVHLSGTFLCAREAHSLLKASGAGAVVNVSSIAGVTGLPRRNAYGAAKAGIAMITKSLACEWAADGIRVNAVAPGFVATALVKKLEADGFVDAPRLRRRIPMARLADPMEIAEAILFLASKAASYVTGSVLSVDGGWAAFGDAGDASSPN